MKQYSRRPLGHLLALPLIAAAFSASAAVPEIMHVPAGNYVSWRAPATGVITYECLRPEPLPGAPGAPVWRIIKAKATLSNKTAQATFSSPPETWQASDGSNLTGMEIVRANIGENRLYDQLVIANPSGGPGGILTGVTYIQRLVSSGGGAPTTPCDVNTVGKLAESPYTAEYVFWSPN
ncbi:DUF3455 domain-containing protein [Bordetella avium]|uniref:Exported protein n=1 Tax=Bordetella avium (strain 197N) TaxID=360910 RepID=Q2KV94_BORA1|nr:DUF3455 domain-containing protein [Bordetella avium]AZY48514.1 DUF3455 domain-containing protein [Bordetella avium]RIQ13822.1 DUF3455 domain-containing protein [Bordetella avium]RIQ17106.1 DUF3455 domain-containing protein [Bordetella avium]RIQ36168.1 DUF3455 domain-containing protein [Bordetella avium]RIQ39518.1 DUF3455 domain-containing protein [Bordetella avium]